MSWDEAFANRYEEWSAHVTADAAYYVEFARQADGPEAKSSPGVFVASPTFDGLVITDFNRDHDDEGTLARIFTRVVAGALAAGRQWSMPNTVST